MGFVKEVYGNNRAGLVVAFGRGNSSSTYFNGNNIEDAMNYFNMYLKDNNLYIRTANEAAIEELGITTEEAVALRTGIDTLAETLTDEQAATAPILFPQWKAGIAYAVGARVRFENKLYKVLQAHTSQEDWTPTVAPSLFAAILIDEENGTILAWVQPESTNGYAFEDKVIHNDKFWISTRDNNIWEPGLVGTPWDEYIVGWENGVSYMMNQKVYYENTIYISLIDQNTSIPTSTDWVAYVEETASSGGEEGGPIPEWVQPDMAEHMPYMIGDQVMYEGVAYESLIDNNVWSPADYPAGWLQV